MTFPNVDTAAAKTCPAFSLAAYDSQLDKSCQAYSLLQTQGVLPSGFCFL
jgi:hypothetical protein